MAAAVLDRESVIRSEWTHSCTSQCPNPCPASGALDEVLTPVMVRMDLGGGDSPGGSELPSGTGSPWWMPTA